jgi:hypothetical protein
MHETDDADKPIQTQAKSLLKHFFTDHFKIIGHHTILS